MAPEDRAEAEELIKRANQGLEKGRFDEVEKVHHELEEILFSVEES